MSIPEFSSPSSESASGTRYTALGWLCVAAMIGYMCRNSIGVAESTIRAELDLSEKQMGLVMGFAFFLPYSLAQIPSGVLGDRWGTRRTLPMLAVVWSLATGMMGLATGVLAMPMLMGTRLVNGLAQAGMFPCSTNTVAKWFSKHERAVAAGALASAMSLGGGLGGMIMGALMGPVGWRGVFALFSGLGIIWAAGFYVWFRDRPEDHTGVNEGELSVIRDPEAEEDPPADEQPREPTPWAVLVASPAMWCICGQQFFRGAGYMFFASWFPTYLQQTRGVSVAKSGLLSALPMVSVVIGGLAGGILSDALLRNTGSRRIARQGLAVTCLTTCAILILSSYGVANPLLATTLISIGTLFFAIGGSPGYAITIDMGGRHVATVFSTMNMAGNLGAMLFASMVPQFREWTGSWDSVLFLFGGTFLVAAVCWLLLNPNGTVFEPPLDSSAQKDAD